MGWFLVSFILVARACVVGSFSLFKTTRVYHMFSMSRVVSGANFGVASFVLTGCAAIAPVCVVRRVRAR